MPTTRTVTETIGSEFLVEEIEDVSPAERLAHGASTRPDIHEVAAELNPVFGRDLLAIMTGVQNPRTVTQWIRGESEPHPGTARVLRDVAYVATFLMGSGKAKETVQAWFVGMNPQLKGQSPAAMIKEEPRRVLNAAKAFVQYF